MIRRCVDDVERKGFTMDLDTEQAEFYLLWLPVHYGIASDPV